MGWDGYCVYVRLARSLEMYVYMHGCMDGCLREGRVLLLCLGSE